ncbi:armadillo-type protein [Lentinula raphanica]|uniref:Armadillo-type protein n=1 Tax=Lentinula raphanica TaxID=153919 RepID=A0AA38NWT7_9AGAR|nr:armadillo-type protein [Lentinula raphanica]
MSVFQEKPYDLPVLDAVGLDISSQASFLRTRTQTCRGFRRGLIGIGSRSKGRTDSNSDHSGAHRGAHRQRSGHTDGSRGIALEPVSPVSPLRMSENQWDRKATAIDKVDQDSPELLDRKVKALLNKLTTENFDSISDQIIMWANKSEQQSDGRTLIKVTHLILEKAMDEATWSEVYAHLSCKMMEKISPKVQDGGMKDLDGNPVSGGQLFRKHLLRRCQDLFERAWVTREAQVVTKEDSYFALYSDGYYAAQKAKRQGLGLIAFIGELFKLHMLTERIMHECVKRLLSNAENAEVDAIDTLCKLLTAVGRTLDTANASSHMNHYFSCLKILAENPNFDSRTRFMLQDVIELRQRKWQWRKAAPTTATQLYKSVRTFP